MQADAGRIAAAAVAANASADKQTDGIFVELYVHHTSAGAWRQLLDTPPGRSFLCDAPMADIEVPLDCEGLGELLHFLNKHAHQALLGVGSFLETHRDDRLEPEVVDAWDLRLAQAVRGLPAVNAGLSLYLRPQHIRLPHTVEACREKGLRCIEQYQYT